MNLVRTMSRSTLAAAVVAALLLLTLWPGSAASKKPARRSAQNIGFESFEPTIGATANGDLYFSTTPDSGPAIGWQASIAKSQDGGRTWKDVGPRTIGDNTQPPETNDPYIYVDPATDRVFTFHMSPILTCSIMSFSDDGGKSWETNPKGCSPTVVWDHQTMVAAKSRGVETEGYPNVLHQCVNTVYAAMCSRSLDGGLSWEPSVPVYANTEVVNNCGAQHGHLANGPKGHVYLPTSRCGTRPQVYISGDDGQSWRQSIIADMDTPFVDPSVSVDKKGNLYAVFINENGFLFYATSRDNGKKWSKPAKIARSFTANMPVIVAGDPGKVVVAYPATNDLPKGYATKGYLDGEEDKLVKKVAWGANFTVTRNGLARRPDFKTTVSTGSDPIGRGRICVRATRCDYLIDFIEAVLGPDGRPYASFVDGCLDTCSKTPTGQQKSGTGLGLMTTLRSGKPLCKTTCWRYAGADKARIDMVGAWRFALSPTSAASSLEHSVLTAEERELQEKATQRRLEAVDH
jgi:hypothetical protein